MQEQLVPLLRCPVTRSPLRMELIKKGPGEEIQEAILWAHESWFYPVVAGIPRLLVEAFIDYRSFLSGHIPDYESRVQDLHSRFGELIGDVIKKNKRTKESFAREWGLYDYDRDRTWDAGQTAMLNRFFKETAETAESVNGKYIFDAGCGNGHLDILLAGTGAKVIAMDFSLSIERAALRSPLPNLFFVQGDLEFPPLAFDHFDIVHSSGVLHHTADTEKTFAAIAPCVKKGGKLSVWLYHPRKNISHLLFNRFRNTSSKWPLGLQYYFYRFTIFPATWLVKKLKGNPQNSREMMIDILDWFTPQYRWEHEPATVVGWFYKRKYEDIRVTTRDKFGFNTIGTRSKS